MTMMLVDAAATPACEAESMPCPKRRRSIHSPTAGGEHGEAAAGGELEECRICLESLHIGEGEERGACNSVVRLSCGHAFHATRCLATFVEDKYTEVRTRVEGKLKEQFEALGLIGKDRQAILGGNFVDMLRHGQLRQCPRCMYGPVLNTHCGDMRAHDAERGHGSNRTTNQCPTCGFFSAQWSDWAMWDPEDLAAAVRCPLCRDPCKLAKGERVRFQKQLAEVDGQLSRATWLHRLSHEDLSTLTRFLQEELNPDGVTFEDVLPQGASAEAAARELLRGPFLGLLKRRLAVEEASARRFLASRAWRSGVAEDRQAYLQRLLSHFGSAAGTFDGIACAAELQSVFPAAPPELLAQVKSIERQPATAEAALGGAVSALLALEDIVGAEPGELLEETMSEPSGKSPQTDAVAAWFTAIDAVQGLQATEARFKAAWAREDFLHAMHIAEDLKPAVEAVVRPLAPLGEALTAALRPLRWDGERFADLPDLDALLRVLQSHVPWPYAPSSVANCVAWDASRPAWKGASDGGAGAVPGQSLPSEQAAASAAAGGGGGGGREALNRGLLDLAREAVASVAASGAASGAASCAAASSTAAPAAAAAGDGCAAAVDGGPRQQQQQQQQQQAPPPPLEKLCEELADRRHRLELLLSTARKEMDGSMARRLAQPWDRRPNRVQLAHCHHGRMLCEVMRRRARLRAATRDATSTSAAQPSPSPSPSPSPAAVASMPAPLPPPASSSASCGAGSADTAASSRSDGGSSASSDGRRPARPRLAREEAMAFDEVVLACHLSLELMEREMELVDPEGRGAAYLVSRMHDLQRRAFCLRHAVHEQMMRRRERMDDGEQQQQRVAPPAQQDREMVSQQQELEMLVREHLILLMHRVVACGAEDSTP